MGGGGAFEFNQRRQRWAWHSAATDSTEHVSELLPTREAMGRNHSTLRMMHTEPRCSALLCGAGSWCGCLHRKARVATERWTNAKVLKTENLPFIHTRFDIHV